MSDQLQASTEELAKASIKRLQERVDDLELRHAELYDRVLLLEQGRLP